jgi:hypothetical protein
MKKDIYEKDETTKNLFIDKNNACDAFITICPIELY